MVDPISVSLGVAAAALIQKASESGASTAGALATKGSARAIKRLSAWIGRKLTKGKSPTADEALALLNADSLSAQQAKALAGALDSLSEKDERFSRGLEKRLQRASERVAKASSVQAISGDKNIQIADTKRSKISITSKS